MHFGDVEPLAGVELPRIENVLLDDPHAESAIISALDQGDYYALCSSVFPMRELRDVFIPTETLIPLGTVLRLDPPELLIPSALMEQIWTYISSMTEKSCPAPGSGTPACRLLSAPHFLLFSRFDSNRAQYPEFVLSAYTSPEVNSKFWMAQANHIFAQLETTSNFKNYGASLLCSIL
jgi:hypothetical protein